jgi:hypothetical protein
MQYFIQRLFGSNWELASRRLPFAFYSTLYTDHLFTSLQRQLSI